MSIRLSDTFNYKKLLKFTLPSVVMMLVTSIYSIVDGFFVSNYAGKNPFAAVNLIMPVLMALAAFGFMIGTGGSALVAMTLGEKKEEKAKEYFTMLVGAVASIGAVLAVIGFIFMPGIARLLGAGDLILDDCITYGRIIICALPFFMLQNSYQSFLVAAEKPKMGLAVSVVAGILNIILDFILVYLFRTGIAGAAVATTISQIAGGLIPTLYFLKPNSSLLCFTKTRLNLPILGKACANGSSEMLTNLSASIVGMLYNYQLLKIASENGVAAYGVIMYVNFIFMAFYFGYSIGCGPVVGYHYGAGNRTEIKSILKKNLVITSAVAVIMTLLAEVLAPVLAKIYVGYDWELCSMTVTGMRLYSLSFIVCGYNIFGSAFFTGLNNGKLSAIISFLRTFVFQIIAIFLFSAIWGINGTWLAIVAAESLTLVVTVAFLITGRKKYGY